MRLHWSNAAATLRNRLRSAPPSLP
jgi:hypothetical protein